MKLTIAISELILECCFNKFRSQNQKENNMLQRKLGIGLLLALTISLIASQVFAGSTSFNVIVPKFGGHANTNVTTKSTTTQQWIVSNIAVGAGYTVYFRPYKGNSAIGSSIAGTTGSYINAPYSSNQTVGSLIYLRITNKSTTVVNVQVTGFFDSN